jgi:hypothetical protein
MEVIRSFGPAFAHQEEAVGGTGIPMHTGLCWWKIN